MELRHLIDDRNGLIPLRHLAEALRLPAYSVVRHAQAGQLVLIVYRGRYFVRPDEFARVVAKQEHTEEVTA